jgi:hypothetical protein
MVELLVTTALMSMVGAAVVAVLFGGIRVFQRVTEYGSVEQAAMVTFDRFRRDIEGMRRFSLVPFAGAIESVHFAAAARAGEADARRDNLAEEAPEEIGRLSYYRDARARMLCRSFTPYRLMRRLRVANRCQPVLEDVERVRFQYFGASAEGEQAAWVSRWDGEEAAGHPTAVKATVTLKPAEAREVVRSFVIYLPVSADAQNEDDEDDDAS